jgi:hypothetical protein
LTYQKKVIPFVPEKYAWNFLSFETDTGKDVADDWDCDKTFEAEQVFFNLVRMERKTKDYLHWTSWRHPAHGKPGKAGVVELGFKADSRPYRVLCVFDGSQRIVVLCVCYHKGPVWTPKEALKIATDRANLVRAKKAKLNVIQIEDDF